MCNIFTEIKTGITPIIKMSITTKHRTRSAQTGALVAERESCNKFIWIFLSFFLISYSDTFAEQSPLNKNDLTGQAKIDSLLIVLKTAKDTNRVRVLNALCWEYRPIDPDKALYYGKRGLALGKKLSYKSGIAGSLNNLGSVYLFQGSYEKAIKYFQQAGKISGKLGNKQLIAANLNDIGVAYMYQGNYVKSLNFFIKSLNIREELGNTQKVAASLGNVGIVYFYLGNYEKAIEYYLQCLDTARELGDKQLICGTLNNIGAAYQSIAKYEKAIDYYRQSLKLAEELGNKQLIAANLGNMGYVYEKQENYQKAIKSRQKALKVEGKLGEKHVIANNLYNLGRVYNALGNFEKALYYSKKSLSIAKEIGSKNLIKGNYWQLSETYATENNYKKAYQYHLLYSQMKDSLFNAEKSEAIGKTVGRYEAEKEQRERELKEKAEAAAAAKVQAHLNVIYYSAIAAFLVLLFFIILFSGRFAIPIVMAKSVVFVGVILLFEFILVLIEPMVEYYTSGNPALMVVINSSLALLILPLHNFLVNKLVQRVTKMKVARRKIMRKSK
ncbi:MAG: tetratricopeptide repeat protein [Cytophagales bacterium]|nr:tetratricopeptide repeat protein [Cytophagales bacterium]